MFICPGVMVGRFQGRSNQIRNCKCPSSMVTQLSGKLRSHWELRVISPSQLTDPHSYRKSIAFWVRKRMDKTSSWSTMTKTPRASTTHVPRRGLPGGRRRRWNGWLRESDLGLDQENSAKLIILDIEMPNGWTSIP